MRHWVYIFGTVRPNFMVLSPICALLGIGVAAYETGHVDTGMALLAMFGAVLAHAAVNWLNEYGDYRSGLDEITVRTPFSGGSGTLPAHPEAAQATLLAGLVSMAFTALIGIYFLLERGIGLLPLGVLGMLIVFAYTPWITRRPLLCLLAPGIGFGPLMVMGTAYVLTGHYTPLAAVASLVPMFLVSDLLLINQFPDVEADQKVGRRHLPITMGRVASARIYAVFLLATFLVIVAGLAVGMLPKLAAIALIPLPLALILARGVTSKAERIDALMPLMGMNVVTVLGTTLLLALGLLYGS